MDATELKRIANRAASGEPAAQDRFAEILERAELEEQAVHWLGRAAAQGHRRAATRLALREIAGAGVPANPDAGFRRLADVAEQGDAEAAHLEAICHVAGLGTPRDIALGLKRLDQAARKGHALARQVRGLLLADRRTEGDGGQTPLHERVNLSWFEAPFQRHVESDAPRIEKIREFLPLWVCNHVVRRAAPALQRARVVDVEGGESIRDVRTNSVTSFGIADSDVLLELINLRAARAVDLPPEHAEGLGVLHYRPGESYLPHYDFIPETAENATQLMSRGQRVRTLLVYLNEGFEGGETDFPRLGVRLRPAAGWAVTFPTVTPEGQLDQSCLHAGLPPRAGNKWLISKWFRTRPLRPVALKA